MPFVFQKKYRRELFNCAKALMSKYQCDDSDFGKYIFTILITLISLKDPENDIIDTSCLQTLAEALSMQNKYQLWNKYSEFLLMDIRNDPKSWTAVSANRCIFETILLESGKYIQCCPNVWRQSTPSDLRII